MCNKSKAVLPELSEEQEQIRLFQWAEAAKGRYPVLRMMFHVPNGGSRSKAEAGRFKAAGVKAGVPDLFLPVPKNGKNGLFIEMKKEKGGVVSEEQKRWLRELGTMGYACRVAHGWIAAKDIITAYLEGKE